MELAAWLKDQAQARMTCKKCRKIFCDLGKDTPCDVCFPGIEPGNEDVLEAFVKWAPCLFNGMGCLQAEGVRLAALEKRIDPELLIVIAEAFLRHGREKDQAPDRG